MPESSSSSRPLTQHLDDLYALAYVLVGTERAEALVTEAYRRATATPSHERPDDARSWMIRRLLAAYTARQDEEGRTPTLRRDAARQTAERVVPVAFATCASRERMILTLDVMLALDDAALAHALDVSPETARKDRDAAWESLRAALRDLLTGPERMLADTALTEDVLHDTLRNHLDSDTHPAPTSLRSDIAALLREPPADASDNEKPADEESADEKPEDEKPEDETSGAPARAQPTASRSSSAEADAGLSWRRILLGALSLLLLGAAAYVFTLSFSPAPEPDPTLTTFSARRVAAVSAPTQTDTPADAVRLLREKWKRRVNVPSVRSASLVGVAHLTAGSNLEVPALLYADSIDTGRITVFAYNYALLDRIGDRAQLDADAHETVREEGRAVVRRVLDQSVVLWRERDDLFLAVASHLPPDSLRSRLGL
jgi:DNA-directed RNA polymerase specialized sigma24 family protein